ncbi:MAG: DNA-directed RNA polymerase, partial [Methanoregula sp.]|nr:DNA-directed RNA polymerase [Methanoregula sp.]
RVVTLSLNEREPRDSKIGLTMRQAGLGTALWLEEEIAKEKEKAEQSAGAGATKERAPEKAKSKRKEHASGE